MSSVSVAIATYNRSAMVRQAVEAALKQTLPPKEICVFDDASTDDTWARLRDLAARHAAVRPFRQEKNTGGVENWNAAIRATTGSYIAWCSDDDRFAPDHLAASVRFLDTHPQVGFVHSGFIDALETETGSELRPRPPRFPQDAVLKRDDLITYLIRYYDWPFHPSTIVMRRAVWDAVGPFDPRYALADTDWFVRAVERFPAALLARHGVLNRRHPGNWSNRLGSAKMQHEICAIVENSIARICAGSPVQRWTWTLIWRTNVRLRLLLTARARIGTGHASAACAAWEHAARGWVPSPLVRAGSVWIRRQSGKRAPGFDDPRQSVSPL